MIPERTTQAARGFGSSRRSYHESGKESEREGARNIEIRSMITYQRTHYTKLQREEGSGSVGHKPKPRWSVRTRGRVVGMFDSTSQLLIHIIFIPRSRLLLTISLDHNFGTREAGIHGESFVRCCESFETLSLGDIRNGVRSSNTADR